RLWIGDARSVADHAALEGNLSVLRPGLVVGMDVSRERGTHQEACHQSILHPKSFPCLKGGYISSAFHRRKSLHPARDTFQNRNGVPRPPFHNLRTRTPPDRYPTRRAGSSVTERGANPAVFLPHPSSKCPAPGAAREPRRRTSAYSPASAHPSGIPTSPCAQAGSLPFPGSGPDWPRRRETAG